MLINCLCSWLQRRPHADDGPTCPPSRLPTELRTPRNTTSKGGRERPFARRLCANGRPLRLNPKGRQTSEEEEKMGSSSLRERERADYIARICHPRMRPMDRASGGGGGGGENGTLNLETKPHVTRGSGRPNFQIGGDGERERGREREVSRH